MVAIQLDRDRQEQLERMASADGRDVAEVARQILEDYLDLNALKELSSQDWAEGCVALSGEVFDPDDVWEEDAQR
jgi:predicted transcriptional regulator